jgi:3-dehydroquinate synthase
MRYPAFCAPCAPPRGAARQSVLTRGRPRRLAAPPRMAAAGAAGSAAPPPAAPSSGREQLPVCAASHEYPIVFRPHGMRDASLYAPHAPGDKVLIVTNETVGPLYLDRVADALREAGKTVFTVVLPDGEQFKSVACLGTIWDACLEHRLDRKSTLVALGGGVIGDITGFAAATYVRGVPFIQVPTTLLAVVDSAVGGKTAVNHPRGKNMIGAFYQPNTVIVDRTALDTLDDRQMAAGFAEIVKYGLIRDWAFFEWCEDNVDALRERDPAALQYAMRMSCQFKADVVAEDERESGVRAILNLGHTFGHAIEASMGYGAWLHGEAVAAGMVMACEMSARLGWIDPEVTARAERVLARASLPVRPPPSVTLEKFMTYMSVDKKVEAGVLRLVLLKAGGEAVVTSDYPEDVLFDTIMHYHALFKRDPGRYEHNFPPERAPVNVY